MFFLSINITKAGKEERGRGEVTDIYHGDKVLYTPSGNKLNYVLP